MWAAASASAPPEDEAACRPRRCSNCQGSPAAELETPLLLPTCHAKGIRTLCDEEDISQQAGDGRGDSFERAAEDNGLATAAAAAAPAAAAACAAAAAPGRRCRGVVNMQGAEVRIGEGAWPLGGVEGDGRRGLTATRVGIGAGCDDDDIGPGCVLLRTGDREVCGDALMRGKSPAPPAGTDRDPSGLPP